MNRYILGTGVVWPGHTPNTPQETQRNPYLVGFLGESDYTLNVSVSSNLDDRTMHELYLWPFYDAVYAGVGSVMCSVSIVRAT
jgi:beta-glucosidase